jgi:hypothetical protein
MLHGLHTVTLFDLAARTREAQSRNESPSETCTVLDHHRLCVANVSPAEAPFIQGIDRRCRWDATRAPAPAATGSSAASIVRPPGAPGTQPNHRRRRFGRIQGLRRDGRDRLSEEFGFTYSQHGPVGIGRSETRHRLRQIGGGQNASDTFHTLRRVCVDGLNSGAGAVQMYQLDVQRVIEANIGCVLLRAGHALNAAHANRGLANHVTTSAAAATASMMRL